jgi:hypothetical protein
MRRPAKLFLISTGFLVAVVIAYATWVYVENLLYL